ncbi:hypothetical protein C8R44DRAFT_740115 [Mycena epipterygia]|nr:hypothetical protein C8R44DRAFT_740115 [Mycena epipterygia]
MDFLSAEYSTITTVRGVHSILPCLNDDIILIIIFFALGDFSAQPAEYDRIRRLLCQVNKQLLFVVTNYPLAWAHLYVDFNTYVPYLRQAVIRSKRAHCDILIDLTDASFLNKQHWGSGDVESFIDEVFTVLSDSWNRCRSLSIQTSDNCTASVICRDASAVVSRPMLLPDTLVQNALLHHFSRETFCHNSGLLRELSLNGVVPRWSNYSPYSNLRVLRLQRLQRVISLKWRELTDLLSVTTRLTHLELISVTCTDIPRMNSLCGAATLPSLPRLDHLSIGISHLNTAYMASKLVLPNLRSFALYADTEADLASFFMVNLPYARLARFVALDVDFRESHTARCLLACFDSVERLDITRGSRDAFAFICDVANTDFPSNFPHANLCTNLTKLVVPCGADVTRISRLLLHRKSVVFGPVLRVAVPHDRCHVSLPVEWTVIGGRVHKLYV